MEEKIQNILLTIWEQSLNIEDEDLLLKKLNKICFKDFLKKDQISKYYIHVSIFKFKTNQLGSQFIKIFRNKVWR